MSLIVSISGIRGVFGSGLHPTNLVRFSAAYGMWARERSESPLIVVGRDSRVTGQICEDVVCATLQSVGCDVIRTGIVPTPTLAMAVMHHKATGGIVISASHNPGEWNALKLLDSAGEFLDAEQGANVLRWMEKVERQDSGKPDAAPAQEPVWRDYASIGSVRADKGAIERHIQAVLDHPLIDRDLIAGRGFRVAVDAVNGAGSEAIPQLLQALGATCLPLHCTPDGRFPHNPEPLPEHLHEIRAFVAQTGADLGVVTDPDADRLALVDEKGRLWGEEYTQAAAFDFVLGKRPGDVATNLSSSRVVDDVAARYGVVCHRSAVGEINVVGKMKQVGAVIGGEGNGGVIDPELHYGRDSLIGTAMVLQMLAERGVSASDYRQGLPDYVMSKQKQSLDALGADADTFLADVERRFSHMEPDTTDGVRIDFEEGWVHMRKSNTEPIVRFYSEARDASTAETLIDRVLER